MESCWRVCLKNYRNKLDNNWRVRIPYVQICNKSLYTHQMFPTMTHVCDVIIKKTPMEVL
jgi:hypothetical protein